MTEYDFLAENNVCGQNLLKIVSWGNSVIAEILRLKDYIPDVLRLNNKIDQQKYKDIILDFSYLQAPDEYDKIIENNLNLRNLDNEFRDTFLDLIERYYYAFQNAHQYGSDLQQYIDELNRGYYIQYTVESVLDDPEGKQIMCEALYLFGVMLIVIDLYIPGPVRERLLILWYRYSPSHSQNGGSRIDDVCMLFRSTEYSIDSNTKKVAFYPEKYFARFSFDQNFVDMVIARLRSDDVFNQLPIYPHPDHRSTALSNQAGMLFICLFFSTNILHHETSQMREIVDRFFPDNWVVHIYMGLTINLIDAWNSFKAAKSALSAVIEPSDLKEYLMRYRERLTSCVRESYQILKDGILTENYVLENISKIKSFIRSCNVTLRWFCLHTTLPVIKYSDFKNAKLILDLVVQETQFENSNLFELLLNTSELELVVGNILKQILTEKHQRWEMYKSETLDRLNELKEIYAGSRPLLKIVKNKNLTAWFLQIVHEIEMLIIDHAVITGHKIVQIMQALGEVQEFHDLHSNMQIKQYLEEARQYLHNMMNVLNVKEDDLIAIQVVSDLCYAWHLIDVNYTSIMQKKIIEQPTLVIKLRATFLKLGSALEIPLLRINQAKSDDLISVSKYYSTELANYIRKVIQIIPSTIFVILSEIIHLQTEQINEIPTRLEKDKLKDYSQFDNRYAVAKLTNSISVFTEGIFMMQKTLVGVIELDPRQLLEDGIRKELVTNFANALHCAFVFNPKGKAELKRNLESLSKVIEGYKRSFEYIQDYLNIHGLNILQKELVRVIKFNVEKECNIYLRNKIQEWQLIFQNSTIPIPVYPPLNGGMGPVNFIGRLGAEIIQATDPKITIYSDLKSCWFDRKSQKEVFDSKLFAQIQETMGPIGLIGLNRLFAYMFIPSLEENIAKLEQKIQNDKIWQELMNTFSLELNNNKIIQSPAKLFQLLPSRFAKVWPPATAWILELGHKQLLRSSIASNLNKCCKFKSKNLQITLNTLNMSLLDEFTENSFGILGTNEHKNSLFYESNKYLEFDGNYEPLQQIFLITKNSGYISLFLLLFTVFNIPMLEYTKNLKCIIIKSHKYQHDAYPIIIGIVTILRQFHTDVTVLYLKYLCQYVSSIVEENLKSKPGYAYNKEVFNAICFLKILQRLAEIPRSTLEKHLPSIILSQIY